MGKLLEIGYMIYMWDIPIKKCEAFVRWENHL